MPELQSQLLGQAIHRLGHKSRTMRRLQIECTPSRIPWYMVSEYMRNHGGPRDAGPAACARQWADMNDDVFDNVSETHDDDDTLDEEE